MHPPRRTDRTAPACRPRSEGLWRTGVDVAGRDLDEPEPGASANSATLAYVVGAGESRSSSAPSSLLRVSQL